MICREMEERIALHVSGDLETGAAAEVDEHLARCLACRTLAAELKANRESMIGLPVGEIREADYAELRARLDESRRRERALRRWALAAAVSAAVLGGSALVRFLDPARHPAPAAARVETPAPVERAVRVPAPPPMTVARKPAAPRKTPEAGEPLVVKIVTDDPDIVIVWLVD